MLLLSKLGCDIIYISGKMNIFLLTEWKKDQVVLLPEKGLHTQMFPGLHRS